MKSMVESEMEHLLPEEHINRLTLKHPYFLMVLPISTFFCHKNVTPAERYWEQALALQQKQPI